MKSVIFIVSNPKSLNLAHISARAGGHITRSREPHTTSKWRRLIRYALALLLIRVVTALQYVLVVRPVKRNYKGGGIEPIPFPARGYGGALSAVSSPIGHLIGVWGSAPELSQRFSSFNTPQKLRKRIIKDRSRAQPL